MHRQSFVFYESFLESVDALETDAEQLEFLRSLIRYALYGEEYHPSNAMLKMAWIGAKPNIDANSRRYLNGKKGGAPKGNKNASKTAKKQPRNNQKQPKNNQKQPDVDVDEDVDADVDADKDKDVNVNADVDVNEENTPLTPLPGGTIQKDSREEFPDEEGWEDP